VFHGEARRSAPSIKVTFWSCAWHTGYASAKADPAART